MSGERPKNRRVDELQAELNRQALVEIGKRLAELEKKFWDLEQEAKDLRYASERTLATAKRLQLIAASVVNRLKRAAPAQPAEKSESPPASRTVQRKKTKDPSQD